MRFVSYLAALTLLTVLAAYWLAWHFGVQSPVVFSIGVVLVLATALAGAAMALVGYVVRLAVQREPNPLRRIAELPVWSAEFLARRVLPLALIFIFLGAFGTFKSLIPYAQPFVWDATFSNMDRLIFGTDPWRLTHALIGPRGTRFVDIVYGFWFPIWTVALIYFACFADERVQRRFIVAFCAVWIIEGVVLATIFSSVGPCYLNLIHSPYASRYSGLFPLDAPLATAAQAMLEASYRSANIGAFEGISAMPSLHVGVAFLLVLASRGWWRVASSLFCSVIFVGSVHLGWHYASDGIVAALFTALCWQFARRIYPEPARAEGKYRPVSTDWPAAINDAAGG